MWDSERIEATKTLLFHEHLKQNPQYTIFQKQRALERLIALRKKAGYSQKEASRHLDMKLSAYREVERGERDLSSGQVNNLVTRYGGDINHFLALIDRR